MSHPDTNLSLVASGVSLKPFVAQPDDHQHLDWIGNMDLTVLLDGKASGGRLTVIEVHAQRGDATSVHVHTNEDKTFLVLEGGITVWVGDERHHIDAGGIGFLPRNLPHSFRITADRTRILNICTPSGVENFFRAAGWDLSQPKPDGWAISQQILAESAARHGVRITGPPRTED